MDNVIADMPIPIARLDRMIWQPVTGSNGTSMHLAPLSWQPPGAHAALELLADENDALRREIIAMRGWCAS